MRESSYYKGQGGADTLMCHLIWSLASGSPEQKCPDHGGSVLEPKWLRTMNPIFLFCPKVSRDRAYRTSVLTGSDYRVVTQKKSGGRKRQKGKGVTTDRRSRWLRSVHILEVHA